MKKNRVNGCPIPEGTLVIIGGKENKGQEPANERQLEHYTPSEVLACFVKLIKKKDPVLEIVTTASDEGDEVFNEYKKVFNDLGVAKVGQIHHFERKDVLADNLEQRVKDADAFFFSGGDQLTLTSIYGGSPFLTALKEKYIDESIIIGGTSAGAMAMSTPMIYAGNEDVQQIGGEIKITTGLEFLKDVCIDTHFVHRGRFVRMAQLVATNPTCIGIGIEEDTAVIIRNGLQAEVIGSGTVIVVDGFGISFSNTKEFEKKEPVSICNLRVDILKRGNHFKIPQVNPPHK